MTQVRSAYAGRLESRLVEFCRVLRSDGMTVTPAETVDVLHALGETGVIERRVFHDVLLTCLVKRPEDIRTFEKEFASFWVDDPGRKSPGPDEGGGKPPKVSPLVGPSGEESGGEQERRAPRRSGEGGRAAEASFSPIERTQRKSFGRIDRSDIPQLGRAFRRMSRRLATTRGRRSMPAKTGRPDLGRTLRAAVGSGDVLSIERERRSLSRMRLVVLCDISGSMDPQSQRLVKLLHQAANKVPGCRVFAFSTRLTDLSGHLRGRSLLSAAREISENVDTWSSGTRIGSALERLLREHSRYLGPRTVVMVISDGWELGELELLRESMAEIRRRVSKVVWVNPLADEPGFEPSAAGMKAVLPSVDFLGGLDIFARPRAFEKVFGRSIGPR